MALRSRTLGNYPNERREVIGTTDEVLASTQPDGTFGICTDTGAEFQWAGGVPVTRAPVVKQSLTELLAVASGSLASKYQGVPLTVAGVAGCSLMLNASGKFEGSLGNVSQATLDALTAGQLALLADGVRATCAGGSGWDEWAFVGDSITAAGGGWLNDGTNPIYEKAGGRYNPSHSTPSMAGFLSFGKIRFARNFGFGGKGCQYLLDNFSLIAGGRWNNFIIQIGTNDVQGTSEQKSAALAAYSLLLQKLILRCKHVICIAIPPTAAINPTSWNSSQKEICDKFGIQFANPYMVITNQSTGFIDAGAASDNVHPNASTTLLKTAPRLLDLLDLPAPYVPFGISSAGNAVVNGFFQTEIGSTGVATGWSVSRGTPSLANSSDRRISGRIQSASMASLDGDLIISQTSIPVSAGIEYEFSSYLKFTRTRNVAISMWVIDHATDWTPTILPLTINATANDRVEETAEGIFRGRFVPTGSYVSIRYIATKPSGTVGDVSLSIGQCEIRALV